jgi:renalase
VTTWPRRLWPAELHGAFVDGGFGADDSSRGVLAFVADDGDRRGDGAPVLVAHTTAAFARLHLEHPDGAIAPVLAALGAAFGIEEAPLSSHAHRWTFSAPASQHAEPFLLHDHLAVCGDAWGERSAVSTAWTSGHALGLALAERPRAEQPVEG